jgi:tetratricopeptide (TPR) repeat protein
MVKRFIVLSSLTLLVSCARSGRIGTGPLPDLAQSGVSQADTLFRKGSFVSLKQAYQIYASLYGHREYRRRVGRGLFMTSVLLSVREKELGIANSAYLDRALAVLKDDRSLADYSVYADIAGFIGVQGKGVMQDIDQRFSWKETADNLKKAEPGLRLRAAGDVFSAYMFAVLKCAFVPAFGISLYQDKEDLSRAWDSFPGSPLLKFKRAISPKEDPDLLKDILAVDPEFYEADYFLGNEAMARGDLLEAESFYLKAMAGIPESPQATMGLAGIAFAVEEFARSLDFNEKTLALAHEYRDAMLGKAICLSYLGRSAEAITVCERLIGLGYWLLGEGYYWLAWNQHELKNDAAAGVNVEEAKGRLPTSSEVFTLSGAIALDSGDIAKAERDLKEAIRYNRANAEALMLLGDVDSRKPDWPSAAGCFEQAGLIYDDEAAGLEAKIADVRKSKMADERKNALLRRKMRKLEKTRLTEASAFYSAAAACFNCGQNKKAVELAARSAAHPSFKQKSADLISRARN